MHPLGLLCKEQCVEPAALVSSIVLEANVFDLRSHKCPNNWAADVQDSGLWTQHLHMRLMTQCQLQVARHVEKYLRAAVSEPGMARLLRHLHYPVAVIGLSGASVAVVPPSSVSSSW